MISPGLESVRDTGTCSHEDAAEKVCRRLGSRPGMCMQTTHRSGIGQTVCQGARTPPHTTAHGQPSGSLLFGTRHSCLRQQFPKWGWGALGSQRPSRSAQGQNYFHCNVLLAFHSRFLAGSRGVCQRHVTRE